MLKLRKGCKIPFADKLSEEYERTENAIYANVNSDKIQEILEYFIGGHLSKDEIMVGKYNVVSLYGNELEKYDGFFEKYDIVRVKHLVTAWDMFSEEVPGESECVVTNGKTIFDIPELFKERGIYLAERREV